MSPVPIIYENAAVDIRADISENAGAEIFNEDATDENNTLTTTQLIDPYEEIKSKLPWLEENLSENGTLTISQGQFTLAAIDINVNKTECSETPGNGTAGFCTPLAQCQEVFPQLVDINVFNKYFCPLESYVGICCPKN